MKQLFRKLSVGMEKEQYTIVKEIPVFAGSVKMFLFSLPTESDLVIMRRKEREAEGEGRGGGGRGGRGGGRLLPSSLMAVAITCYLSLEMRFVNNSLYLDAEAQCYNVSSSVVDTEWICSVVTIQVQKWSGLYNEEYNWTHPL